jgi:hypothetical protein
MRTVTTASGLTLQIETPRVPLLALDTQTLIEAGRAECGGAADPRVIDFVAAAIAKVENGELVCFETNQREEYLGSRDSGAILAASKRLTYGLTCRPGDDMFESELLEGMTANLHREKRVSIPLSARFAVHPDLVAESPVALPAATAGLLPPVAVFSRLRKPTDVRNLEAIRQTYVGCNYEQVRARELRALERRFQTGITPADAADYVAVWRAAGGDSQDIAGFSAWVSSPYCTELPQSDITACLWADVIVGPSDVKSGDLHDVGHLAAALPVATYVLTDGNMRDRTKRLGLDTRWGVEVFSLKTLPVLTECLRTR